MEDFILSIVSLFTFFFAVYFSITSLSDQTALCLPLMALSLCLVHRYLPLLWTLNCEPNSIAHLKPLHISFHVIFTFHIKRFLLQFSPFDCLSMPASQSHESSNIHQSFSPLFFSVCSAHNHGITPSPLSWHGSLSLALVPPGLPAPPLPLLGYETTC